MAKPIILCDTAGMTNDRWLECRMHGPKGDIPYTVGGSDVAAIFGVSPWTTPMELWLIKKGRMKPAAKSNSNQLMMGHLLEPIAAYWYGQKTDCPQWNSRTSMSLRSVRLRSFRVRLQTTISGIAKSLSGLLPQTAEKAPISTSATAR